MPVKNCSGVISNRKSFFSMPVSQIIRISRCSGICPCCKLTGLLLFRHLHVSRTYCLSLSRSLRVTDSPAYRCPRSARVTDSPVYRCPRSARVTDLPAHRCPQICPPPGSLAQFCKFFAAKKAYAKPPPSTTRTEPVTHADIPLARNSTASAIS
ncbi:hypothetical protein ABH899_004014 [Paenibacillus sp. RC84]